MNFFLSSFSSWRFAKKLNFEARCFGAALAVKLELHLVKLHFQPRLFGSRLLISLSRLQLKPGI